jgi:hypothetical protein
VFNRECEVVRTTATAARPPTALEARKRVTHAHRQVCHAELKWLSCLVVERCWDWVRWAIEEHAWRFDGCRGRGSRRRAR